MHMQKQKQSELTVLVKAKEKEYLKEVLIGLKKYVEEELHLVKKTEQEDRWNN